MLARATLCALWAVWALAAGARGGAGTRLVVSAGGNASCPWLVILEDEQQQPGESRLELCTSALPVAFEGFSLLDDSPEVLSTLYKRIEPPPLEASATSGPEGSAGDNPHTLGDYTLLPSGDLYKVHEQKATWLEAKAICGAEGAHLVVIDSKQEAAQLKAHLQTKLYWRRERPFTLHAGFYMEFATPSGRPLASVGYESWAPGQPAAPLCGRVDHDAWVLFGACSEEQRFICERPNAATAAAPLPPPSAITTLALFMQDNAFSSEGESGVFYKRVELTAENFRGSPWADAALACAAEDARLATLESAADAEALVDFFQALPGDAPRGPTLLAPRTARPVDVLGNPLSNSSHLRWVEKTFPESCLCVDIKSLFHTCSCEDPSLYFLCKVVGL